MPPTPRPPYKFSMEFDGAESTDVAHNLGSRDVIVAVYEAQPPSAQVGTDVQVIDENTVRIGMGPTVRGRFRAVVIGGR